MYCDGYYTALAAAHAAIGAAADRIATRERVKRAIAAEERKQAGLISRAKTYKVTTVTRVVVDDLFDEAVERRELGQRNPEVDRLLRETVQDAEPRATGGFVDVDLPSAGVVVGALGHGENDTAELAAPQREIDRDRITD